jgi:hypothetical protein
MATSFWNASLTRRFVRLPAGFMTKSNPVEFRPAKSAGFDFSM